VQCGWWCCECDISICVISDYIVYSHIIACAISIIYSVNTLTFFLLWLVEKCVVGECYAVLQINFRK